MPWWPCRCGDLLLQECAASSRLQYGHLVHSRGIEPIRHIHSSPLCRPESVEQIWDPTACKGVPGPDA
eukprot:3473792-Amphidinium_carterae.5